MDELERNLQELEQADVVACGAVGFVGKEMSLSRAFDAVAAQLSPSLRPRLERMFDRASPEGRVYAAALLHRVDPQAGREAWRRLADDSSPVDAVSGRAKTRTTVAAYVAAHPEGELA